MSNYNRNPSHLPSRASLPTFPSRTYANGHQHPQILQTQTQISGSYDIQDPMQHIFEELPDVLDPSLEPTLQQFRQNAQPQLPILDSHTIRDPTQACFEPLPDLLASLETTAQQSIQNMQTEDPMLSSHQIQNRDQTHFDPMAGIPTTLEPKAQQHTQFPWMSQDTQQKITRPNSMALQDDHHPIVAPLPDVLAPLETLYDRHLIPETLPSPTHLQCLPPSPQPENSSVPQSTLRRSYSKPSLATKQRSKQQVRSKKTTRKPSAPLLKRTRSNQPRPAVKTDQQSRENSNYRARKAPPNGLPNVLKGQAFKDSLISVLSRSRKSFNVPNPQRSQSTLQPRFPDRPETGSVPTPAVKYPGANQAGSSTVHAMGMNGGVTLGGVMPGTGLVPQNSSPVNRSTPHLERTPSQRNSNPPSLTIRKRPASCSSLPSRKNLKDIGKSKRPCDSVDQAIAEGRELTKEEIRVLKNRQHAFNSRERTKAKKKQFNEENALLRERISQLESENEHLKSMRNTLLEVAPTNLRLQLQMRENTVQGSEATVPGDQNDVEETEGCPKKPIKDVNRRP